MLEGRRGKHSEACRRRFEEVLTSSGDMRITRMLEMMAEEALEKLEGEQTEGEDERPEDQEGEDEGSNAESSRESHDIEDSDEDRGSDDTMALEDDMIMAVMGQNCGENVRRKRSRGKMGQERWKKN